MVVLPAVCSTVQAMVLAVQDDAEGETVSTKPASSAPASAMAGVAMALEIEPRTSVDGDDAELLHPQRTSEDTNH